MTYDNDTTHCRLGFSFGMNADILQMAAKFGNRLLTYVKPVHSIPLQAAACKLHGLTNCCGDLMYRGVIVPIPIRAALSEFLNWL